MSLLNRITVNPNQCGGQACVRSMPIRVRDVLDLLASGMTIDRVRGRLPDLEEDDVRACLEYAVKRLDRR